MSEKLIQPSLLDLSQIPTKEELQGRTGTDPEAKQKISKPKPPPVPSPEEIAEHYQELVEAYRRN